MDDSEHLKDLATVVAMFVRNELEGFHVKHIPDTLMPEFNRTIRNAIYTGLVATVGAAEEEWALRLVAIAQQMVPDYWEPPEFTEGAQEARALWGGVQK